MPLEVGLELAHYEIVEPIGKGGMGEVYRARDGKLGREVAIKVLPEEFSRDAERLARFKREAKVLASLNHPNIAAIHGLEESEGLHYLVLELVPGETLAERIGRGPIPVDEAIGIATKIAEGLEEAHERGIVHRDLKPANIKLTPDDKVKILDFGLAKAFVDEAPAADDSMSPTITRDATRVGVILGTAAYMSPEQAKGKRVDRRTDIFAFGSVLYEMLSGRKAFRGDGVSDVLAAVIKDEPDWSALPGGTPALLRRMMRWCLAKAPAQRVQHIGDVRLELQEPRGDVVTAAAGVDRSKLSLLVTTLVAVGVAVWAMNRDELQESKVVSRWTISLPPGGVIDSSTGAHEASSVAISPDGRYVAYKVARAGASHLYLRASNELEADPIDGGDDALMPFFSPDSQSLAFMGEANGRVLMRVSVQGGAPVVVGDIGNTDRGGSWGADGYIYFNPGTSGGLHRIPEDGGEQEVLAAPRREIGEKAYRFAETLPGDKGVIVTILSNELESFDDASIGMVSLESGEVRTLLEGGSGARYSSSGHLVYARAGALYAVPFDVNALEVTGVPRRVVEGVCTWPTMGPGEFDVTRDGSLVYVPGVPMGNNRRLVWVDRAGTVSPFIEETRAYSSGHRLSPDGSKLALVTNDANMTLWMYDLNRGAMSRLLSGFNNRDPVWAPDGGRIAFSSDREGFETVYTIAADGSGEPHRVVSSDGRGRVYSWTPDGRLLLYEENDPETGWDLWLVAADGDAPPEPVLQSSFDERYPEISPNGRWFSYVSDETGRDEVYVSLFPEGAPKYQVSIAGGDVGRWNPNGGEFFYRNGDAMMVIDIETTDSFAVGTPRLLFRGIDTFDFNVSSDGNRFIMRDSSPEPPSPTELVMVQNWAEELKRLVPTDK